MKRFLSVALSAALLCGGLAVTGVSAEDTAKVRPTVTLAESGFEDGLKAPFIINDGQAVGTQVSLEGDECSFHLRQPPFQLEPGAAPLWIRFTGQGSES